MSVLLGVCEDSYSQSLVEDGRFLLGIKIFEIWQKTKAFGWTSWHGIPLVSGQVIQQVWTFGGQDRLESRFVVALLCAAEDGPGYRDLGNL